MRRSYARCPPAFERQKEDVVGTELKELLLQAFDGDCRNTLAGGPQLLAVHVVLAPQVMPHHPYPARRARGAAQPVPRHPRANNILAGDGAHSAVPLRDDT